MYRCGKEIHFEQVRERKFHVDRIFFMEWSGCLIEILSEILNHEKTHSNIDMIVSILNVGHLLTLLSAVDGRTDIRVIKK